MGKTAASFAVGIGRGSARSAQALPALAEILAAGPEAAALAATLLGSGFDAGA